jgi:hypothetical protein
MTPVFSFFLRLFGCFLAAKFILDAVDLQGRGYLVGLTVLFLVNVYLFTYFIFRDRTAAAVPAKDDPEA